MAKTQPAYVAEKDNWQARDDAETLMRAEEVRADRSRHGQAKKHLAKKAKAAASAADKSGLRWRAENVVRRKDK